MSVASTHWDHRRYRTSEVLVRHLSGNATCRLSNRSLTRCKSSLRCRKDHVVERTEPSVHDVMLLITKSRELGAIYVTGVPKVDHRLWHGAPFSLALSSFVDRLYPGSVGRRRDPQW